TKMEQALRERDELLHLAETSAGIGVWDMDMTMQTVRGTPEFFRILGLQPSEVPVPIETLRALRHPDDRTEVVSNFKHALDSGQDQYEAEYRIVRPDGEVRWVFGRGRIFRDKDGTPTRYSGVDIDITQRKKFEEHLALTTRELSHRTKNILAVVQAMAHQIGRRSRNFADFETRLHGCIAALAHCHDLLVTTDWQGAELRKLVELQLAPFSPGDQRIRLEGPPLLLVPQAAQIIGLALHELGTNAVKHGALRAPEGSVTIDWAHDPAEGGLRLTWRERNKRPIKPPSRTGFGHIVLQRMASAIDDKVSLQFPPEGALWTLRIDPKHIAR
ncbi:MAG TPA: PAS domain-containing protein, partial [Pseudolabrys sp.]|nr:PAS domain-containing protein [Pseudolabrys sp.]